jgi:hypothetical protein
MYGNSVLGGATGATGAGGILPITGLAIGWQVVLAATLIVAGVALMRLAPRPRRRS